MNRRFPLRITSVTGFAVAAAAVASPLVAHAQNGTENYYYPPKIATLGKTAIAPAGAGKVVVKVFVKADGTFTVAGVIKSTNHGDDAAALDIAKHSTYHPAARGLSKTPQAAYYDFSVDFSGSGQASDGDAAPGSLAAAEATLRAGKYTDAETALNAYLTAHPGDPKATADLGVAQSFLDDETGAAASFDKLGTIPDADRAVAVKAYSLASGAMLKAGKPSDAVALAKKAVALEPGAPTYNTLGTADFASGDNASAIADFQKAHDAAGSLSAESRTNIDLNLISALLDGGKEDQAKPLIAEVNSLSPGNAGLQNVTANHYVKVARAADTAQDFVAGEAAWEQAAVAAPSQAAPFYGHAAIDELEKKTGSDPAKARAYADKALAIDPNSAVANYVVGFVLAKDGKKADALTYLKKADASAKTGTDSTLTSGIETLMKQVNGS